MENEMEMVEENPMSDSGEDTGIVIRRLKERIRQSQTGLKGSCSNIIFIVLHCLKFLVYCNSSVVSNVVATKVGIKIKNK